MSISGFYAASATVLASRNEVELSEYGITVTACALKSELEESPANVSKQASGFEARTAEL
ncbi:MAG: hypothetical protein WC966_11540 [Bradymonadales bacterium]